MGAAFSVGFGWDDWRDRSSVEGADEGVGVEGLVGDQSAGIDGFDERIRHKSDRDPGPG